MYDYVIAGGLVVTEAEVTRLDVGVSNGRIAGLSEPRDWRDWIDPDRVIDATDKIVIPGGIDPHVHCDWSVTGKDGANPTKTAGPDTVSRAAAYGGTTTLIDFAIVDHDSVVSEVLEKKVSHWEANSYCDFSFHVLLQKGVSDRTLADLRSLVDLGFQSVKIFTSNVRPGGHGRMLDFGVIADIFEAVRAQGIVVAVHAEDEDMVMHAYRRYLAEGRTSFRHMSEVHSSRSEAVAFNRVIGLAEEVGEVPLYFMHVSADAGVKSIRRARDAGLDVFGETLHQYLLRTHDDYGHSDGMKYHTYPSLKSDADVASLWSGVASGVISALATDELCTDYATKTRGNRIDDVTGGNSGIEPRMSLLYTEMVVKRNLDVQQFVRATSTNAAKIFGMYPRKGVVRVGSDADVVVLDPRRDVTLSADLLHETDYTPWEGWKVSAWPEMTMIGGIPVVRESTFLASEPRGTVVPRGRLTPPHG